LAYPVLALKINWGGGVQVGGPGEGEGLGEKERRRERGGGWGQIYFRSCYNPILDSRESSSTLLQKRNEEGISFLKICRRLTFLDTGQLFFLSKRLLSHLIDLLTCFKYYLAHSNMAFNNYFQTFLIFLVELVFL
jgi:hypothetical protein